MNVFTTNSYLTTYILLVTNVWLKINFIHTQFHINLLLMIKNVL
jgi:hypothetical protein